MFRAAIERLFMWIRLLSIIITGNEIGAYKKMLEQTREK